MAKCTHKSSILTQRRYDHDGRSEENSAKNYWISLCALRSLRSSRDTILTQRR
jgi:hypothetical protein